MDSMPVATRKSPDDERLIGDLYHAAIAPERWTDVLDRMAHALGSRGCAMLSLKSGGFGYRIARTNSLYHGSDALEIYARDYSHHEADMIRRVGENPVGAVTRDARFLDERADVRTCPDVRFLLERFGVLDRFGMRLNEDRGWFDCVTFQYAPDRGDIDDEDLATLRLLRPHLTQALLQSRTFDALRTRYRAVLSMLDHVRQALFLTSASGQIVVANRTANDLLDQRDALRIGRDGVLRADHAGSDAELQRSIATVATTVHGNGTVARRLVTLPRASGSHPCLAEIAPLQDPEREIDGCFRGVMVSVVDPALTSAIDLDGLDLAYGLSASETTVAELLVQGMTTAQIAEQRGVAPETVKSQISSLYGKTGSCNRTELVRRVLQFNVPLGPAPASRDPK